MRKLKHTKNKKEECWFYVNRFGFTKLHRYGDRPAFIGNSKREYYWHGHRHRKNGPAVEYFDGSQEWFLWGQRHKFYGPAFSCTLGLIPAVYFEFDLKEYWLFGVLLTETEFIEITKNKDPIDISLTMLRHRRINLDAKKIIVRFIKENISVHVRKTLNNLLALVGSDLK